MNETNNPSGGVLLASPPAQRPTVRRLVAVLTGVCLLLASLLMKAPAHAQELRVTATPVSPGSLSVDIAIQGCSDTVGATYQIFDQANEAVGPAAPVPSMTFNWTATYPGAYEIKVTCLDYNGTTTNNATEVFGVGLIYVTLQPGTWSSGDQVTISAQGYHVGDAVTIELWSTQNGKELQYTWNATADSNGVVSLTVTWPSAASDGSALPLGSYAILTTSGDRQGDFQFSQMSAGKWGPLAVPTGDGGKDKNDGNNKKNGDGGNKNTKGKLPKTGD